VDPGLRAVLGYELGLAFEASGREPEAAEAHLAAFREDPAFRLPLVALLRLFERRGAHAQLERLYEAEERSHGDPAEQASARLSRAVLYLDRLGREAEGAELLEAAAREGAGFGAAAAMLEAWSRRRGDPDGTARAVQWLEGQVEDPELAALLTLERARVRESAGNLAGSVELLRAAAENDRVRWSALVQLERIARARGRVAEILEALERRAAIAGAAARGELPREAWPAEAGFRDAAEAGRICAALCWEAGRLRIGHGDPAGAAEVLATAVEAAPEDTALGQERVRALERAGDHAGAADEAARLLDLGATGAYAAWLWFRLAAAAKTRGDGEATRRALERALEADPESPAASGSLEDVLLDEGRDEDRVRRLDLAARTGSGRAATLARWRAAQVAADDLADANRADALYDAAFATAQGEDRRSIARERYAAAHRRRAWERAWEAGRSLLDEVPGPDERDAMLRELRELALFELGRADAADALLREALALPSAALAWAGPVARLQGALARDWELLASAHETLAGREKDRGLRAAHRCAAARARARSGQPADDEAAVTLLRGALRDVPDHAYAVALLRELLGRRDDGGAALLDLLEHTATDARGVRQAEHALLRSGAEAEARGDREGALKAYEQATDYAPDSRAPLVALRRLARRMGRVELTDRATEALAALEMAEGRTGLGSLELGERHALPGGEPSLASWPLLACLEVDELAPAAALATLLLPLEPRAPNEDAAVDVLSRALGATREAGGWGEAAEPLRQTLAATGGDGAGRAEALAALGALPGVPREAARALGLAGLRAALVAGDEATLRRLARRAVAEAEAAGAEADPAAAAAADLARELQGEATPPGQWRRLREGARLQAIEPDLVLAEARAELREGRPEAARALAESRVAAAPGELAAWEVLRGAARAVGDWERFVEASKTLAGAVGGDLQGSLLEEAGVALADELDRPEDAVELLSAAARAGGYRPVSEARLHILLAEEEGPASAPPPPLPPAAGIGGAEQAPPGKGSEGPAPEAPPATAPRAVELARRVPPGAARLEAAEAAVTTHLGAGELAEARSALALLEEELRGGGAAGRTPWLRLAELAERLGEDEALRRALGAASREGTPAERRGVLHRLARQAREAGDLEAERGALEELSRLAPTNLPAFSRLLELEADPKARGARVARGIYQARTRLTEDPFDPAGMDLLSRAAEAAGDGDLAQRAARLRAVVHPTPDRIPAVSFYPPAGALDDDALAALRSPADAGLVADLARKLAEVFARVDGLDAAAVSGRGATSLKGRDPVTRELTSAARLFGLEVADVVEDADARTRISLLPARRGRVVWVVGVGVSGAALAPADRFVACQLAFAQRDGILPAVIRSPEDAAALILAAAALVDIPLRGAAGRDELPELSRALGRFLPRRTRRELVEEVARVAEAGEDVEHWGLAAHASALRAALFATDDPESALGAAERGPVDADRARRSPLCRELGWFYLSEEVSRLRAGGGAS
jgi:tetratricopeptide (TPR) repeat protein